jgi:phage tail tube protein FII
VLTNESVIRQLQDAIVGGLSNVWHRSNVVGETYINYLKYDKEKRKVYSIDTENVVTHITGVDFNALYPSAYS